jgi:hypothetical protein
MTRMRPFDLAAYALVGVIVFGAIGSMNIAGWVWWLLGAVAVVIAGEIAIKRGGLNEKVTRGATIALGVILTIAGILPFFQGVTAGNPVEGVKAIMMTAGLDPTSAWSWGIFLGIVSIACAYLWGLIKIALEGGAVWTRLTFGIVTAFVVIMVLGWLGQKGVESVLGEDLTQQIVDGAQLGLKDGAQQLIGDNGRVQLTPVINFDWETFIGWSFVGIIIFIMMLLAVKGNKLITVPLGIVGLLLFLVVGSYQAYKLEPVNDAFKGLGSVLEEVNINVGGGNAAANTPRPQADARPWWEQQVSCYNYEDDCVGRLSDIVLTRVGQESPVVVLANGRCVEYRGGSNNPAVVWFLPQEGGPWTETQPEWVGAVKFEAQFNAPKIINVRRTSC